MTAPLLARQLVPTLDPWNRSIGRAWARVLRECALDPRGTVAEVGPGFTDKVGHGLGALGFRGTVILIEPTGSALNWARERYRQLLPLASVIGIREPLGDAAVAATSGLDALVANHLLDDMLLYAAADASCREGMFDEMRPDAPCTATFIRTWDDLIADRGRLDTLIDLVAGDIAAYVAATMPRVVAIHQYPSWSHVRSGLTGIHAECLRVRHRVEARLLELGLRRFARHDPAEWLLMSASA